MEPSGYKHIVLGLIFLKYISDAFEARYQILQVEVADPAAATTTSPQTSSGSRPRPAGPGARPTPRAKRSASSSTTPCSPWIKSNDGLKGVPPKEYARPALNKVMLGELIDLLSTIGMNDEADRSKDPLRLVIVRDMWLTGFDAAFPGAGCGRDDGFHWQRRRGRGVSGLRYTKTRGDHATGDPDRPGHASTPPPETAGAGLGLDPEPSARGCGSGGGQGGDYRAMGGVNPAHRRRHSANGYSEYGMGRTPPLTHRGLKRNQRLVEFPKTSGAQWSIITRSIFYRRKWRNW